MPNYVSELEFQPSGTRALIKDAAAQSSITTINNRIDNLDINHVYNQSTPDSGLTTNIGLKEGVYDITTDTTINAQLVVPKGAILNVAAGVTLTINGTITAGRYQIFDGAGTIVVDNSIQSFGYPEWFNDDVKKCYAVFNIVDLDAKNYIVDGDLHLIRHNSVIRGVNYGRYLEAGNQCSRLVFTTGRLIIGTYDTQVINDYIWGINVKNVNIAYDGNLEAVSVYGCVLFVMENCYIEAVGGSRGVHLFQAIGSFFNRCYVQIVNNANTYYGWHIDNTGTNMNASVWITECTFGDTGTPTGRSYGFLLQGPKVSDIFLDKCEVAVADQGLVLYNITSAGSVNIHITDCDFDSVRENGILVLNCSTGAATFSGDYIAPVTGSTHALFSINNSTISLILNGVQLINTNSGQIGIQAVSCVPSLIGDVIINNSTTPIVITDTSNTSLRYLNNGVLATI